MSIIQSAPLPTINRSEEHQGEGIGNGNEDSLPSPSNLKNSTIASEDTKATSLPITQSTSGQFNLLSLSITDLDDSSSNNQVQLIQSEHSLKIVGLTKQSLLSRPSHWLLLSKSTNKDQSIIEISYQNIINCQLVPSTSTEQKSIQIDLTFLKRLNPQNVQHQNLKLTTLKFKGVTDPQSQIDPQFWIENLLSKSYELKGVPRSRRAVIIINPVSGSKKTLKIWHSIVEPILKASPAKHEVIFTTHSGHATEIGEKIDIDSFDVVSCLSGDGLLHEFLNGLGRRKLDAGSALRKLVLTSIPGGSGNALSTNHLGPKNAKNIHLATLNLLKGKPVPLDLCSVTQLTEGKDGQGLQEPTRSLSFLSLAFGLMADLDVGTDHLRWMGPNRFILGFLWGALRNRHLKVRLDLQLISKNKEEIAEQFRSHRQAISKQIHDQDLKAYHPQSPTQPSDPEDSDPAGLPSLKFGDIRTEIESWQDSSTPWTTIETDLLSLYAGIMPFMSADLLQFPAKLPGRDGSIDMALQYSKGILSNFGCLIGSEKGLLFKNENFKFYKVKAFRMTPLPKTGCSKKQAGESDAGPQEIRPKDRSHIAVDGEEMAYRPIQVEIHEKLIQTLNLPLSDHLASRSSCEGYYFGSIGVPDQLL